MRSRFVVATESTTSTEDKMFKERLLSTFPGINWWHRFGGFWLFSDAHGRLDAATLRDVAQDVFSSPKILVIELRDDGYDTWAAVGPADGIDEMYKWLQKHWRQ